MFTRRKSCFHTVQDSAYTIGRTNVYQFLSSGYNGAGCVCIKQFCMCQWQQTNLCFSFGCRQNLVDCLFDSLIFMHVFSSGDGCGNSSFSRNWLTSWPTTFSDISASSIQDRTQQGRRCSWLHRLLGQPGSLYLWVWPACLATSVFCGHSGHLT